MINSIQQVKFDILCNQGYRYKWQRKNLDLVFWNNLFQVKIIDKNGNIKDG